MPDITSVTARKTELTKQSIAKTSIAPKLADLKTELEKRKTLWNKVSPEAKKEWLDSGKDELLKMAYDKYVYLRDNFFGEFN